MPKKKTLAEELAELYNPAPAKEYDPDAPEIGDGSRAAGDDDDDVDLEPARPPSKRAPEKAHRLRGELDLDDDEAYRGRKTTRAAMFGNNNPQQQQQGAIDSGSADGDDGQDDSGDGGAEDDDDEMLDDLDLDSDDSGDDDEDDEAVAGVSGLRGRMANGRAGPSNDDDGDGDDDDDNDDGDDLLPSGDSDDMGGVSDEDAGDGEGTSAEQDDSAAEDDADDEDGSAAKRRRPRGAGRAAGGGGGGGVDDELAAMEAEYAAVQQEEQAQLQTLRQRTEKERVQGVAVRHQQALYERALEARILLQKCLQASHALPRPEGCGLACSANAELRNKYAALAKEGRATLLQLLDLQHTLMGRHPEIGPVKDDAGAAPGTSASEAMGTANGAAARGTHKRGRGAPANANGLVQEGAKRRRGGGGGPGPSDDDADGSGDEGGGGSGLDGLWRRLSGAHAALAPFRDASLDRWHTRTVLSSGSGALRNSLRALNQSISSQVAALLKDPAKFIKRSRLTLSALPKVLGERQAPGAAGQVQGGDSAAQAAASSIEAADVLDEERDDETYDDSEFYQQLLKEFIDKGAGAAAANGLPKASKKRKVVDRRASKGRKLRYHVQDKLVAFMAPVDMAPPPFAANLFSNLFGHGGS